MRTGWTAPASGELPARANSLKMLDRIVRLWWCGLAGLLLCLASGEVHAQDVPRPVVIGTVASPPGFDGRAFGAQEPLRASTYLSRAQQPEALSSTLPALDLRRDAWIDPGPVRAVGTDRLIGAAVGFVVGAGVTYAVLHSGGSTSRCNRSENQDAWSSGECLGVIVGGGVIGAVAGAVLAGVFRSESMRTIPGDRFRLGVSQHDRTNVFVNVTFD